jgi:tetratricopeptide (TPR) repeat protein
MSEEIAADLDRAGQAIHEVALEENANRYRQCIYRVVSLIDQPCAMFDVEHLDEAIGLGVEALVFSRGDAYRIGACLKLASSLLHLYDHHGDDHSRNRAWDKAMSLKREALALCPQEHPDRAMFCRSLAGSLMTHYERSGDDCYLDESMTLDHESLDLCPPGHPDRDASCGSLARSLLRHYTRTRDNTFLDDVIDLEREALELRPQGHPDHAASCGNLAIPLSERYDRTGDAGLLDEAIRLQREALAFHPRGHPNRAIACQNLAVSLRKSSERMGDNRFLDEAINLQREALAIYPQGHPDRAQSCSGLANLLSIRYLRTGDSRVLDEEIDLGREALALYPQRHPKHARSCSNLATSLNKRYTRTHNEALLDEILILTQKAQTSAPVHSRWAHLCNLSWLHLKQTSTAYDVKKAIQCLSEILDHELDHIFSAVGEMSHILHHIWDHEAENNYPELVNIYQRLIKLLLLLANSALEVQPQLQALKGYSRIGSDAFVNAALAEKPAIGLELLESAQGVIWSQGVHRQDPQMQDVPEQLAKELEDHLQALTMRLDLKSDDVIQQSALTPQDLLHHHSSHASNSTTPWS